MTATTIRVQMAQRKDTAANWTAANPILLSGEIGYETDTKKFKIGNGSTNWNSLAYLPIPDGSGNLTITGNLEIGSTGSLTFEGSTADGFETTLAVTNPTADRTITLPNQSGTVLVSGNASIVDADIAANAEIAVSKLADGTARQLLQTDAAGTGVEWTSDVDVPGTLDVTSTATFDSIAQHPLGTAGAPTITFTGDNNTGIYSPGADQVAISTNGTGRLFVDSSGRVGIGTSSPGYALDTVASPGSAVAARFRGNGGANNNTQIRFYGNNAATDQWAIGGSVATSDTGRDFHIYDLVANANRFAIDSSGRVGIGTTSPSSRLHISESFSNTSIPLRVYGSATGTGGGLYDVAHFLNDDATTVRISEYNTGAASIAGELTLSAGDGNTQVIGSTGPLVFKTNVANGTAGYLTANERARIDSSGRLLVGTSSARSNDLFGTSQIQLEGTDAATSSIQIIRNSNNTGAGGIALCKSRSSSIGGVTVVQSGDVLGFIDFQGTDGTDLARAATIEAVVDGTPGNNDMPGRLVFSTTADGASSPTERMRIQSDGNVVIGKAGQTISYQNPGINLFSSGSADFTRASAYLISVNRKTDDGVLVEFYQDNNLEGTISVSGTTVSYNGAHLSRWSQLPSGTERTEILRGSVLSNIDEMCEWGEEDNEQLNRMKVSDVEGDKNVSGVFQAWDDDDDTYTNDFYCAMTGDFIIRIGAGVTVERGDLLMSAGDGTAKPQDDDIIRSKTIAKVTSTNVSCTYDDGSYCVPCVLMAC